MTFKKPVLLTNVIHHKRLLLTNLIHNPAFILFLLGHVSAATRSVGSNFFHIFCFSGKSPEDAADAALNFMKTRVGGLGGVIVISRSGDWAARFSTNQMSWATVEDDQLQCGIYAGERHRQSVEDALSSVAS